MRVDICQRHMAPKFTLTPLHVQRFVRTTLMTTQHSPLRQRMRDDMAMRNMSPNTQKVWTYAVAGFARFHHPSPDKLALEEVRRYRLYLLSCGLKAKSIKSIFGALRFFYGTVFHKNTI